MIKSILLAVDGSAFTEPVLKYGIELSKKFQALLRVLTVIDIRIFEWAVAIGRFRPHHSLLRISGRIPEDFGSKGRRGFEKD